MASVSAPAGVPRVLTVLAGELGEGVVDRGEDGELVVVQGVDEVDLRVQLTGDGRGEGLQERVVARGDGHRVLGHALDGAGAVRDGLGVVGAAGADQVGGGVVGGSARLLLGGGRLAGLAAALVGGAGVSAARVVTAAGGGHGQGGDHRESGGVLLHGAHRESSLRGVCISLLCGVFGPRTGADWSFRDQILGRLGQETVTLLLSQPVEPSGAMGARLPVCDAAGRGRWRGPRGCGCRRRRPSRRPTGARCRRRPPRRGWPPASRRRRRGPRPSRCRRPGPRRRRRPCSARPRAGRRSAGTSMRLEVLIGASAE